MPDQRFPQHKSTQKNYDRLSTWYDLFSGSEAVVREKALDYLFSRPGDHILEVGCGTGHLLPLLASQVGVRGQVAAVDLSLRMAKIAKRRLAQTKRANRTLLSIGDAICLPYADQSFDGILSTFTIELFNNDEIPIVLRECFRLLRSEGRHVIVSLHKPEQLKPVILIYEWLHRAFPKIIDCRPIQTQQVISQAGFEILEHMVMPIWGLPIGVVLSRKPRL